MVDASFHSAGNPAKCKVPWGSTASRLINTPLPDHPFGGEPAPTIEPDGHGQDLAERMHEVAQPGGLKAYREDDADQVDDSHFHDGQPLHGARKEEEHERQQEHTGMGE